MEAASPFISSQHNAHQFESGGGGGGGGGKKGSMWNLCEPETGSILDPFQIEDLLDFSNEDIAGPIGDEQQLCSNNSTLTTDELPVASAAAAAPSLRNDKNEFPIDCGDMPELDWLSSLVEEDSFNLPHGAANHKSSFGCSSPLSSSANVAGGSKRSSGFLLEDNLCKSSSTADRFQVGSPISVLESTSATSGGRLLKDLAVPGRPRSKRMRTGVSSWKSSPSSSTPTATNITPSIGSPASVAAAAAAAAATNINTNVISSCSPDTSSVSVSDYNNNNVGSELHDSGSGFSLDEAEQDNAVDSRPPPHEVVIAIEPHKPCTSNSFSAPTNVVPTTILQPSRGKPPLLKSSPALSIIPSAAGAPEPRRCTHCLSQKTPQWRAGPEGPKTLCNACGVRFKSGRLFPEYRPALSPTFVSDIHSNSHRKVLEMRKQKHVHRQGEVVDDGVLIYKSSSGSLAA